MRLRLLHRLVEGSRWFCENFGKPESFSKEAPINPGTFLGTFGKLRGPIK